MTGPRLSFWYEFASTYSYVAAMQIEAKAAKAGVDIVWRPFLLGPLLNAQQGLTDTPFNVVAEKGRHMWRDLERICAAEGLPLQRPSVFPRNSLLAARVALVGLEAGWTPAFTRAVYTANFAQDHDISDRAIVRDLLGRIDVDAEAVLAEADGEPIKTALRVQTKSAQDHGVFGAPSFLTSGGELFWGQDRLDQALAWAKKENEGDA